MFLLLLRVLAWTIAGLILISGLRRIAQQYRPIGSIVGLGLLLRAVGALSLFSISYWRLPIFRSLQGEPGFWTLALDASGYYTAAASAVTSGMSTIVDNDVPSPIFVTVLSVWMHIFGVNPLSGPLLNLFCFLGACSLLIHAYRPAGRTSDDLPLLIALSGLSFSPVLVINATQTLKDDLFLLLMISAFVAAWWLFRTLREGIVPAAAAALLALVLSAISGVRTYYPQIVLASLIAGLGVLALSRGRGRGLAIAVAGVAAAVLMLAIPFDRVVPVVDGARAGFIRSGGNTNLASPDELLWLENPPADADVETVALAADASAAPAATAAGASAPTGGVPAVVPLSPKKLAAQLDPAKREKQAARRALKAAWRLETQASVGSLHGLRPADASPLEDAPVQEEPPSRMTALLIGLSSMVVPMALLQATDVVEFSGGRGLLPIVDGDTLLMDVALVAMGWILYRRRHSLRFGRPFATFTVTMALLTTVLMAYVVTNFGTLYRMRYMAIVPILALALAIVPHTEREEQ